MRFPLKPNKARGLGWLFDLFSTKEDPRQLCGSNPDPAGFEGAISTIKMDDTWKSTRKNRQPATTALIANALVGTESPILLIIGASSGMPAVELIRLLGSSFGRCYVTDIAFSLPFRIESGATWFYHPTSRQCVMRVSNWLIAYRDIQGAVFPFGELAKKLLSAAPEYDSRKMGNASLASPDLIKLASSDSRIIIREYDCMEPWHGEPADVISAANILNRSYFSDEQLQIILENLSIALKIGGRLVITDNRPDERVSVLVKRGPGTFALENEINGGAESARAAIRQVGAP